MKRISNFLLLSLLTGMFFTSCVKDRNVGPDFSSTQPMLELKTPQSNFAGQAYFAKAVIGNLPDTVQFYANLAAANAADRDIAVTIGVDQSRMDDYNADPANALKYELLPDSDYVFLKTQGTIVKGQHIDSFQVSFLKDKMDPTKNYMLPVAITDGDGVEISQNQGVIFFHAIGNPIAGLYTENWLRWDAADTTGTPTFDYDFPDVPFSPTDPTTIEVQSQGTGEVDIITFENNGGVLSNFQVALDPESVTTITVTSGPFLLQADPDKGIYVVYFEYNNSSGLHRCIKNTYVKQ